MTSISCMRDLIVLLNHRESLSSQTTDCFIKPWGIFIVTNYCLLRNKVAYYTHNSVAEDRNFLVHFSTEKGSIQDSTTKLGCVVKTRPMYKEEDF